MGGKYYFALSGLYKDVIVNPGFHPGLLYFALSGLEKENRPAVQGAKSFIKEEADGG